MGIPFQDYELKLAQLRLAASHPADAWLCSTSRQHDELFKCWSLLLRRLSTPTGLGSWCCWWNATRILASKLRPIMTKHDTNMMLLITIFTTWNFETVNPWWPKWFLWFQLWWGNPWRACSIYGQTEEVYYFCEVKSQSQKGSSGKTS